VKTIEDIAGFLGILLTMVAIVLLWRVNWILGFVFSVFVLGVAVWYLRTKKQGNSYLKEVAGMTQCKFQRGGLGYGRVSGSYRGHKIEVSLSRGYDSLRGLAGFTISMVTLDSVMGVLAGIENFTAVIVEHKSLVKEPFKLDDSTYVDEHLMLYFPPSDRTTGLPEIDAGRLVTQIDNIIRKAEQIETSS